MNEIKPLHVHSYLNQTQIDTLLENVDYIIMATPSMLDKPALPIHFSIILNTLDSIPNNIKPKIIEKFCIENNINITSDLIFEPAHIAFAQTTQETPMPRHLIEINEINSIPSRKLQLIDFLGNSENFTEAKNGLTGWSYN